MQMRRPEKVQSKDEELNGGNINTVDREASSWCSEDST